MKVGENNLVALLDENTIVTIIPQEFLIVTLSIWLVRLLSSPFYDNIVYFTI